MNARIVAQGSGCPLVKEDSHAGPPSRSSGGKTAFSMPQDGLRLLAADAGKPLEKIIQPRAIFEVLEQRFHRDSRAFEDARAADFAGNPFHRRTLAPVEHHPKLPHEAFWGKAALNR